MKKLISILLLNFILLSITAQESLKSIEEDYYDFLSLTGVTARPTLGYRTLSDNVWTFNDVESFEENEDGTFTKVRTPGAESDGHIWKNNNLGTTYTLWQPAAAADNWFARGVKQGVFARVYGPEWFNSYNTAAPYGQNDGALWQGRGYNTSLTTGIRLEGYGFELTFKPQVSWMQNREFDFITPNYSATDKNGNPTKYNGKASTYGYYGVASIDAPQRFGDKSFWTFDWGDTEVRYTWNTFTAGFGTQAIWLGPAKLNPIIHSNNAASYPKIDIGIRKTYLIVPYFGWNLGAIEVRGWWGKLSESDWFDNDDSNDERLISGLAMYYQFPFLKDFTVGLNRTMLSYFDNISKYTLFNIFIPGLSDSGGSDDSDQRISLTFDYKIEKAGFELYLEWGKNDYSPSKDHYLRYPFHTQGWSFGAIKTFDLPFNLRGNLQLEITSLECSMEYDRILNWLATFYAHHRVIQGYTNEGQWLAAGIGTGGNSQYLGLQIYFSKGFINLFAQRRNPDLDFTMYLDTRRGESPYYAEKNIRAIFNFGFNSNIFITKNNSCIFGIVYSDEHNPLNINHGWTDSEKRGNLNVQFSINHLF